MKVKTKAKYEWSRSELFKKIEEIEQAVSDLRDSVCNQDITGNYLLDELDDISGNLQTLAGEVEELKD